MLVFGQAIRAPQRLLHIKSRANPWGTLIMLHSPQGQPLVRLGPPGRCHRAPWAQLLVTVPLERLRLAQHPPSAGCCAWSLARCAAQELSSILTLPLMALEGGSGAPGTAGGESILLGATAMESRPLLGATTSSKCWFSGTMPPIADIVKSLLLRNPSRTSHLIGLQSLKIVKARKISDIDLPALMEFQSTKLSQRQSWALL